MERDVVLYLNDRAVEFTTDPNILFTYQRTDYTNPTVIKNSFTKTITLEGTPTNNKIFGSIFDLSRTQDRNDILFNPSQRTDFKLFRNGEMIESGYVKLENIKKNGYKIAYEITLFGGLSQFFYGLTYDEEGEERTMTDLNYLNSSDPDSEFDFKITKDTIKNAWSELGNGNGGKWNAINFAPAYNGIPEDFDADKCLINMNGLEVQVRYTDKNKLTTGSFPNKITVDGEEYKSENGYIVGDLHKDRTEWEMRDLRSYLQRPVLSVKAMIGAMCNRENNGGYDVELDEEFFNDLNPYYAHSWMTLPMINSSKVLVGEEDEEISVVLYENTGKRKTNKNEAIFYLTSDTPITTTPSKISITTDFLVTCTDGKDNEILYTSANDIYGAICLQLVGFDDDGNALAGSRIAFLTSKVDNDHYLRPDMVDRYEPKFVTGNYTLNEGYFENTRVRDDLRPDTGGNELFKWNNKVELELETNGTEIKEYAIVATWVDNGIYTVSIPWLQDYFYPKMKLYTSLVLPPSPFISAFRYDATFTDELRHIGNTHTTITYTSGEEVEMRSGAQVTKRMLLSGLEGTPCDYLLSYCKIFNLYLEKDLYEDKIYIKLRKNWFKDGVIDLEKYIDKSQELTINPLAFDTKWYSLSFPSDDEGRNEELYHNQYGSEYGKQRIDTQYNFDAEDKELLEDNVFKNGVTVLEKSNFFNNKYDADGNLIPSAFYNWVTCTYKSSNGGEEDIKVALPANSKLEYLNPSIDGFWDANPKLQLHSNDNEAIDGIGVLCFFNGFKNTGNASYFLTDDVQAMFDLNDNPCWFVTMSETGNRRGSKLAIQINSIPEFSRMKIENNNITYSWDFGRTKELFLPTIKWGNKRPTIYENFWRDYIQDLYSVNTRVVDAYVRIDSKVTSEWMKHFFFWDNSIWVCTKITDYDILTNGCTKCTFTKVNDIESYRSDVSVIGNFFEFSRSDGGEFVSADETDIKFKVFCNDRWNVYVANPSYGYFTPTGGSGMKAEYVNFHLYANTTYSKRQITFFCTNGRGETKTVVLTQYGMDLNPYIRVTPSSLLVPPTGGEYSLNVETNYNWAVNFSGLPDWVRSVKPYVGTKGNTEVRVVVDPIGTDSSDREATIKFENKQFQIDGRCTILQSSDINVSIERTDGRTGNIPPEGDRIEYTIISNVPWNLSDNSRGKAHFEWENGSYVDGNDWIMPTGTEGVKVYYVVSENPLTVTRLFDIHCWWDNGEELQIDNYVTPRVNPLIQDAHYNEVNVDGNEQGVNTRLALSNVRWTALTNDSWITINGDEGTDGEIEYNVESNNDSATRTGYVYVTYGQEGEVPRSEVIRVNQFGNGYDGSFNVTPPTLYIPSECSDYSYIINIEAPSAYTVKNIPAWITIIDRTPSMIIFKADNNDGENAPNRTATLIFTCGDETRNVSITQEGNGGSTPPASEFSVTPRTVLFEVEGGNKTINIKSNNNWNITIEDE